MAEDSVSDALRDDWLSDPVAVRKQLIQHIEFRVDELSSPDDAIREAAGRRLADARAALGDRRPGD